MKCIVALVSLAILQVASAGKLRSEEKPIQIEAKSNVAALAEAEPGAWEPQLPSNTAEGKDTKHPSDDPPDAWQPQYPSSQSHRQGKSQKQTSDRGRKHASEKSDEKISESDSEKGEQNNTELEIETPITNESSSASDDDSSNRSSNQTDNKEDDKSEGEGSAGSKKKNESEGNSTSIGGDQERKTGDRATSNSPWQEFLPSCREKLKHLVKVAEASYSRPQIEVVLESECELDREFPSVRDRFFDRRKECKDFAHKLAKARVAEVKGETNAYDGCCKLWWKEAHEDKTIHVSQHDNSHLWLWVVLGMLAVGLAVAVVMNHFESS
eukprot:TRINITY_DN1340_c0_g1_i1.p1 TRINITY_DN1340_c0_g1~~TRINITY_DN1340_c0_g1_i1.p1  ORF type:complete len:325 (-),score=63.86 TRINITY_DN1340_c0_g1_i1:25-999(-)